MSDIDKKLDDIISRLDKLEKALIPQPEPFYIVFDKHGYCEGIDPQTVAFHGFNLFFKDGYIFLYDDNFRIDLSIVHDNVPDRELVYNNMLRTIKSSIHFMTNRCVDQYEVIRNYTPTKLYYHGKPR